MRLITRTYLVRFNMAYVFIICVVIAMVVFFILMICNQDSSAGPHRKLPQVFKNCLSIDNATFIDVKHVPINGECPSSTKTCPQYDGCDNKNIPFCRNDDGNGNYGNISCPACENGQWKCDFFMMGNNQNGVPGPNMYTPYTCSGDSSSDRLNCEYEYCENDENHCKWGGFNTGGIISYGDKGESSEDKVSGYKVSSSGNSPIFNISSGYDASEHFYSGGMETIGKVSLQGCIAEAEQPYSYGQNNFDGSYGFVYDTKNSSCDLYKVGDGVPWDMGTAKLVRGG